MSVEGNEMKIFIIHSFSLSDEAIKYAQKLREEGNEVYIPIENTDQDGSRHNIIKMNLDGIKWCDEVHVIWDGKSSGSVFDLGTAYALKKSTKIVKADRQGEKHKSWTRFVYDYRGKYIW